MTTTDQIHQLTRIADALDRIASIMAIDVRQKAGDFKGPVDLGQLRKLQRGEVPDLPPKTPIPPNRLPR